MQKLSVQLSLPNINEVLVSNKLKILSLLQEYINFTSFILLYLLIHFLLIF